MLSTIVFRSAVIVMCDLAAATAGAWILWNSSATSVVNGPVEDKLLFVFVLAFFLSVRHTVSRSADSFAVKSHVARVTLVTDFFVAAAFLVIEQATGIYYFGWLATFALVFFIIGAGFQLLVDVATSRYRRVATDGEARRSEKKSSFATELTRLGGVTGAVGALAYMSPFHGWDVVFINPLVMMISVAIGASIVPAALSHTGVITRSSLADNLDFSPGDRGDSAPAKPPNALRRRSVTPLVSAQTTDPERVAHES